LSQRKRDSEKGGVMTASSRLLDGRRRSQKSQLDREEPGYVRTVPHDGNKYIDPNEFVRDDRVRKQVRRLARDEEADTTEHNGGPATG